MQYWLCGIAKTFTVLSSLGPRCFNPGLGDGVVGGWLLRFEEPSVVGSEPCIIPLYVYAAARSRVGAYVGGAVLGAFTPFCTCSTIPVLAGLLRGVAPFGPTMTFLFASPLLDPVVLGLLAFVIGLKGAAGG